MRRQSDMEISVRLTKELSQGQDLAKQLQSLLFHSSSPPEMRDSLLQSILSCYDRALSSLILNALSDEPLDPPSSGKRHPLKRKRKDEADMTERVWVEGGQQEEDGYSWRKYGQKRILDAKYPRGYFRCTHRPVQGCLATKMVQRSDDDPSVIQVTYRGRHTCIPPISYKLDHQDPTLSPSSIPDADKTGQMDVVQRSDDDPSVIQVTYRGRHTCIPPISYKLDHQDQTLSPSSIPDADKTGQMDVKDHIFPPFSFLATPGIMVEENVDDKGTYLDALAEQGTLLEDLDLDLDQGLQEQTSESGLAEIFLAPALVTHSPVVFPLHELGFDKEFPFDDLEFFS